MYTKTKKKTRKRVTGNDNGKLNSKRENNWATKILHIQQITTRNINYKYTQKNNNKHHTKLNAYYKRLFIHTYIHKCIWIDYMYTYKYIT